MDRSWVEFFAVWTRDGVQIVTLRRGACLVCSAGFASDKGRPWASEACSRDAGISWQLVARVDVRESFRSDRMGQSPVDPFVRLGGCL